MPSTTASEPSRDAETSGAGAIGTAVRIRTLPASVAFLAFGPLLVLCAYYVQTRIFDLVPFLYALPAGCLAAALCGVPRRAFLVAAYLLIAARVHLAFGLLLAAGILL